MYEFRLSSANNTRSCKAETSRAFAFQGETKSWLTGQEIRDATKAQILLNSPFLWCTALAFWCQGHHCRSQLWVHDLKGGQVSQRRRVMSAGMGCFQGDVRSCAALLICFQTYQNRQGTTLAILAMVPAPLCSRMSLQGPHTWPDKTLHFLRSQATL